MIIREAPATKERRRNTLVARRTERFPQLSSGGTAQGSQMAGVAAAAANYGYSITAVRYTEVATVCAL